MASNSSVILQLYAADILFSGGGIAGLVTAIALTRLSSEKRDIRIEIFESAQAFSEIGAGIGMSQRPWEVMKTLHLQDALKKIVEVPENENEPRGFLKFTNMIFLLLRTHTIR